MSAPYLLSSVDKTTFPDVDLALRNPDGLLAVGGDLSRQRLVAAYRQGIFPWFSQGEPIIWWSPNPRSVLFLDQIHISRSLKKSIKQSKYTVTFDTAFTDVMHACAAPRAKQKDTWILPEMIEAYTDLYNAGYAHSIELWQDENLVGGLYGIALDKVFFGESMFSRQPNASKIVMVYLANQLFRWGFKFMDCQVYSEHLESMGAASISRNEFITLLNKYIQSEQPHGTWQTDDDLSTCVLSKL